MSTDWLVQSCFLQTELKGTGITVGGQDPGPSLDQQ